MKNFSKVIGILLLVVFAASCSNGILSNSSFQSEIDNGKCLVNFSISNFSNSRTIMLEDLGYGDIGEYKISGKSSRGETLSPETVTVSDNKGSVTLSYAFWELTLEAYGKDDSAGKLLLKGTTSIDLSNGKKDFSFLLSEKDVTTPGSVDFAGTYEDLESNIIDYTISGLYNINTGKVVGTENTETTDGNFTYTADSLDPGEYIFKVKLMGNGDDISNTEDDICYLEWSGETIKVSPGRKLVKTDFSISKDLIGSLPSTPSNLTASLVADSEKSNDTYKVKLDWTDNSTNETHFIITVNEIVDGTEEEFLVEKVLSSVTTTKIELKLGKLYDVSIEAANRLGSSDSVARVATTDFPEKINRYKITYNLNGGIYKDASGSFSYNKVDYHTYGTEVILPTHSGDVEITKDGNPLVKWVSTDDNKSEVTTYNDYKNLSVIANYNLAYEFGVNLQNYAQYEMEAEDVSLTFKDNTVPGNTFDASEENGDICLTFNDVETYDEFMVILAGGNKTNTEPRPLNGNTFTINTSDFESAKYIIVAIARSKETNNWYSYTLEFEVTR